MPPGFVVWSWIVELTTEIRRAHSKFSQLNAENAFN